MSEPRTYGVNSNPFFMDSNTALSNIRNGVQWTEGDLPTVASGNPMPQAPANVAIPTPTRAVAQPQQSGLNWQEGDLLVIPKPAAAPAQQAQPEPTSSGVSFYEDQGVWNELSRGVSHGLQVTTPKMVGQALQFFGADETGANMVKNAQARETAENRESKYGQNLDSPWSVRGNLYEAADQGVMSLAPGAAGAVAGATIGSVVPGVGTAAGALIGYGLGSLAALPFFYGSQGQETYEKVKDAQLKAGASPDKAESEARWAAHESGAIEAGGELAADVIPFAKLFKPFAKPAAKVTATAVKDIMFPTIKEGAKTVGKVVAGEVGTEMLQTAGESAVEGAHGAGPGATWDETSRVIMPTALMSLIPGMAGAASHHAKVAASRNALEDKDTDPTARTSIALGVMNALDATKPEVAKDFALYAGNQIQNGLPIEMQDDAFYKQQADFLRTGKIATPDQTTTTSTSGKNDSIESLNPSVTELDDDRYMRDRDYFDRALKKDPQSTVSVLAAIYRQEKDADKTGTAQTNPILHALETTATRIGVYSDMIAAAGSAEAVQQGEQLMSDFPSLRGTMLTRAQALATTLPAATTPKKDNRITPTEVTPMTEEEVMNVPPASEQKTTSKPVIDEMVNQVKSSENPGQTAATIIQSTAFANDTNAINGWTQNFKDKNGVITHDSPDGKTRVFTHQALPDVVFSSRNDLFHAFALLKAAKEARQAQIARTANPAETQQETKDEPPSLNDEDMYGDFEQTPPSSSRVVLAKEDVKDALYHLWDVASDSSGSKMNITGQRYTAKDLPAAIQKVMESLVKLGYVKLSDISEKLIERMKANKNWQHLVDAVTPQMLRDAYNALPSFEGKETLEEPAFEAETKGSKATVSDLVAALPSVVKNIVQTQKETFASSKDLGIIIKRRMKANPKWAGLADKLTDGMVRNAYEQTTKSMSQENENERTGIYRKGKTTSAAELANQEIEKAKQAETEETTYTPKERTDIERRKDELVAKIRSIYKQSTNAAFYQGLVNNIERQIDELEERIRSMNVMSVKNADGSVTTYFRRSEGQSGMEEQVSETGRMQDPNEYYEQGDRAIFDNPDTKAALLAKKRILELELRNAIEDKVSNQAKLGKLGIRVIRRQIDEAIQEAVSNGLPVEESIEIGREWIGSIDSYLKLSKVQKAEKQAQQNQEMEEFLEQMNTAAEEAELPSDVEFAHGLWKDISSRKITINEAISLIDQAANRGELTSKRGTVTKVLTDLVSDYGLLQDSKAKDKALSGILDWASKAKKEGLLRFDDFVDIFHSNNLDVPHEIVKMGEVAASRGLLDYMAENKHDPAFRYYWLRSMDRVVRFRPDSLESPMFTDLERDLYAEWKAATTNVSNRRKQAYEQGEYQNLLFNKYSLDDMRNPERLPLNQRMRLKEIYSDLVEAYFGDMLFALRNGYGNDLTSKLDTVDQASWQEYLDRKNKSITDEADRVQRQKYFKMLSQFKHIGDESFDKLYQMMATDSVANLPMIYDMAVAIEREAITGNDVDVETGEIKKFKTKAQLEKEENDRKNGIFTNEDDASLFEQNVASAAMNAMWDSGKRGMSSDASMPKSPMLDFDTYNEALSNKFTTFYEDNNEQNASAIQDDDLRNRMVAGEDIDEINMLLGEDAFDNPEADDTSDDARLRQGQYFGFLNTGLVTDIVNQITKTWKNAPNIVVLQSHLQLPEGIREEVTRKLSKGMGAKGLFDSSTGTIYLFSNFLSSRDDVEFTLFHEAYGHLGLRLMFGKDFDTFLQNIYDSNANVRAFADKKFTQGGMGKLEAVEEALSDMAGDGRETGAVKEFVGRIIAGLRKIGLNRVANYIGFFTDAELSYSLQAARQYAEDAGGTSPLIAGPRDIRLSDERPPYEIFAKKGINTTGYARYDPITGEYYVFIATNGDIRKGSKMLVVDNMDQAVEQLEKLGTLERRKRSGFYRDDKVASDFVNFINSQQPGLLKRSWDRFLRSNVNQYIPVFRLVEQMEKIGRVSGNLDLRKYLRTTERQTAVMVEDFNKNYVQPIMDLLAEAEKSGGTFMTGQGATNVYEMLNKFLLAQTAEERNKQVNSRNPKVFAGSGMASESSVAADPVAHPVDIASAVLEFVQGQPYAEQFEKIGKLLDKMSDAKVNFEEKTGLLSSGYYNKRGEYVMGEADKRRAAYEHYRNLSGVNNELDEDYSNDPSLNVGKKFNVRGKDKNALGRGDEAPDILARTLLGAEASIIRGNKNLIAQRILAFFETNYDPNFVSINEQAKIQQLGADGFVELVEKPNYYNQPDVFIAKVNGIPVTIRFKDSGYTSVAEAIHGKVEPQSEYSLQHIMRVLGRATGAMITKYNPYWIPVNFVRDVQTLFLNSAVNGQVGTANAKQMMKELLPAMGTTIRAAIMDIHMKTPAGKKAKAALLDLMEGKVGSTAAIALGAAAVGAILPGINVIAAASIGGLIGSFASNSHAAQERMSMYEEGRKSGAFTSFINRKDLESQVIEIDRAIHGTNPIEKLGGILKFWEIMTIPVEMAPRLAAYSVMRKNGSSSIDAADYAGGVTVDFNMRGANEWVRSAYLFFNPAIQGTAQMARLLRDHPKRFAVVASGLFAVGFLSSMFARMAGGDDDDERKRKERGISILDEIPDYKRATNLILAPGKAGGAVPVAYGWNAPFAAGVFMADSVVGDVPASLSLKRTIQAAIEAFSPVGGSGFDFTKVFSDPAKQLFALFSPTVFAPVGQWEINKNRWGGPLYPDGQFSGGENKSDTTKAFSSVNPISRWVADTLQEVTGGDRRNHEGIEINPALIDHISQSYLPGLISEWYKGAGIAVRKSQGLDVPREKEPLTDRFSAYPQEAFDAAAFRRIDDAVKRVVGEMNDHPSHDARFKQLAAKHPEIGLMQEVVKLADADLRELRADVSEVESAAYILRKDGQIQKANEMDAKAVELRNQTKKAERVVFDRVVNQAAKSGFKREIYSD